ncbi:YdcF family protein [Streptomyces mayteni]
MPVQDKTTLTDSQWRNAQVLWDYHLMRHESRSCSVGIGLGSHDLGVATCAAALYGIAFSRRLLEAAGIEVRSVLLICKPYMERRVYATCRHVWPEVEVVCASEPLTLNEYVKSIGDERLVVDMIVGDLQRVIEYPARGYAIPQPVPDDVHAAYQRLLLAGFDSRLMQP